MSRFLELDLDLVATNVERLLLEQCISASELAELAFLQRSTVRDLLERRRLPQRRTLRKIAKALGVDPRVILGLPPRPESPEWRTQS